jgi:hypothetical protein
MELAIKCRNMGNIRGARERETPGGTEGKPFPVSPRAASAQTRARATATDRCIRSWMFEDLKKRGSSHTIRR